MSAKAVLITRILAAGAAVAAIPMAAGWADSVTSTPTLATYAAEGPDDCFNDTGCGPGGVNASAPGADFNAGSGGVEASVPGAGTSAGSGGVNASVPGAQASAGPGGVSGCISGWCFNAG
jgi:hypothetical protein